ncbi:unnamed protein product [Sphagnum jensenii]|uniref:Uncharacterized protein n=1 Tax=Sphagnum jensenii TaxID=128206 RepID=A0ABP1B102_9BRYO
MWNPDALAMWARAADRVHALLFLLLHFIASGPPRGEEYKSYLIRNTEHSDRTFYWSAGTVMTFQRYHKGANAGPSVKLIPRFLPPKLAPLFVEYMLLVRPVQSFIAGLRGNIDVAHQYANVWAIERDAPMDGGHVSSLVATAFREHANLDLGMADYRHLAAYFGGSIKQSYCTEFPIDKTSRHSSAIAARHYVNCSNDHRFMNDQQMYTYKLAAKAWHRLLRLNGSPIDPPLSTPPTPETTPTLVPQPDSLSALPPKCASLLASLMYSIAQTAPQSAVPPPP